MDLIRELGPFALASRLQRLSEHLKKEVSTLYHAHGLDFDDQWFLVGYSLARNGEMTMKEMAGQLSLSRPTVSRMIEGMAEHGLIKVVEDASDPMRRRISLTGEGEDTVEELERIWTAVGEITGDLIAGAREDLLGSIEDIEGALEERSLFSRVSERLAMEEASREE